MINKVNKTIGKNIKVLRRRLNMTQTKLAADVNLSRASITNIEIGNTTTTAKNILNLCNALQCTPNDLFPITQVELTKRKVITETIKSKTNERNTKNGECLHNSR